MAVAHSLRHIIADMLQPIASLQPILGQLVISSNPHLCNELAFFFETISLDKLQSRSIIRRFVITLGIQNVFFQPHTLLSLPGMPASADGFGIGCNHAGLIHRLDDCVSALEYNIFPAKPSLQRRRLPLATVFSAVNRLKFSSPAKSSILKAP